ncbi:hypothetical protein IWZ03DRAFT_427664 [Phyllosticta citriasiana]|uniref:Peptidase M43 pregnancy-associated plasma-A domain-containing protein n=1 Tax=Phyllosticta citriasiana TaxID=595635 RepID=A0ABR1L0X4_9PEZI
MMFFLLLSMFALDMASPTCPSQPLARGSTNMSEGVLDTINYIMQLEKAMLKSSIGAREPSLISDLMSRPQVSVYIHVLDDYNDLFISPFGFDFHLQGVLHHNKPDWAKGNDHLSMAVNLRLGGYDTLNIYLMERTLANLGGLATNPASPIFRPDHPWFEDVFLLDGMKLCIATLPYNLFGVDPDRQEGKVLVHEVRHWLSLFHIYENGCDPDLENGGDRVFDTSPQSGPFDSCISPENVIHTCNGPIFMPNLLSNAMDRIPDACCNSFTQGQIDRMYWVFNAISRGMPPANAGMPPIQNAPTVPTVAPNLPLVNWPQFAALDTTYIVGMLQDAVISTKSSKQGVEHAVSTVDLNERLDCLIFFHILDDYSEEGIYQSTFLDQFNILKAAYAPVLIDFHLGGIYYYDQPLWANGVGFEDMTRKLRVGGYDVLNIYIKRMVDSQATGKIAGYSKFPNGRRAPWDDLFFYEDGVLIATFALPTKDYPGGVGLSGFNWGTVAIHEVGHWFGLWHIFEDGCDPDLKWGGDKIADTTPQEYFHGVCYPEGSKIDTCPGYGFPPSLINNYMGKYFHISHF